MQTLDTHVERLLDLKTHSERAAYFSSHGDLATPEFARVLCRSAVAETARSIDRAHLLCEALDVLATACPARVVQGYRAHAWAAKCHQIGADYQRTVGFWKLALDHFLVAGRHDEAAITSYCGLLSLHFAGEMELFWEWEARARAYFESTGDRLRLARLRGNVAAMHFEQREWAKGADLLEAAFDDLLISEATPSDLRAALANLAIRYRNLGDLPRSVSFLDKARRLCEDAGLHHELAHVQTTLAFVQFDQGDFLASLESLAVARAHFERLGVPESHYCYRALSLEAEILQSLCLPAEAKRQAEIALDGFSRLGLKSEQAKALTTLGRCAAMQGQARIALELYSSANRLYESALNGEGQRLTDLEKVAVLLDTGHHVESQGLLERLLAAESELPLPLAIKARLLLSRALMEQGQLCDARRTAEKTLARASVLEQAPLEAEALFLLGTIYERSGLLSRAYDLLLRCERCISRVRKELSIGELKIAFLSDKAGLYESLFTLGLSLGHGTARLLAIAEKSKSRTLAEQLAQRLDLASGKANEPQGQDLLELWGGLRASLKRFEQLEASPETAGHMENVRSRLSKAEEATRRLLQEARYLPGWAQANVQSANEVAASLPDGSAMVELYFAQGIVYAFVLCQEHLRLVPLASTAKVEGLWRLAMFQMRSARRSESLTAYLSELYELLWSKVPLPRGVSRIVVVPHGFLHGFPFHALFDGECYLASRFSFTYSPSANVFYASRTRPRSGQPRGSVVVGLADERAPAIAAEVDEVAEMLPQSRVLLGGRATKVLFTEEARHARFVHIAAHGCFNPASPQASAVTLGDGLLTADDIERLELSADLVVLSGCETGRNAKRRSDELLGLTQALLRAGARAALVSLWPVEDASTAAFMREFYSRLTCEIGLDMTLQMAMSAHRQAYPEPFFWAPFILVGDPAPG